MLAVLLLLSFVLPIVNAQGTRVVVSQEDELLMALADSSVGEIVLTKNVTFTQAEWNKYPRPIPINRSISLVGATLDVIIDMNWLKNRVLLAPSPAPPAKPLVFEFRNVTVTRVRTPSSLNLAGIDLVSPSPGSFQHYRDLLLIADACVPIPYATSQVYKLERPASIPNEYGNLSQYATVRNGGWCLPGAGGTCWPVAGWLRDVGLVAIANSRSGAMVSSGVVLYQNCTYVCRTTIPQNCFGSASLDNECFQAALKQWDLLAAERIDDTLIETARPPPPPPPPTSPPSGGDSGPPLEVILPATIVGGLVLLAALVTAMYLALRRRRPTAVMRVQAAGGAPRDPKDPSAVEQPIVELRKGSSFSGTLPAPLSFNQQQASSKSGRRQSGYTGEDTGYRGRRLGSGGGGDTVCPAHSPPLTNCSSASSAQRSATKNRQFVGLMIGSTDTVAIALERPAPNTGSDPDTAAAATAVAAAGPLGGAGGSAGGVPARPLGGAAVAMLRTGSRSVAGGSATRVLGTTAGSSCPVSASSEAATSALGIGGAPSHGGGGSGAGGATEAVEAVITATTPMDQSINMNMVLGRDLMVLPGAVRGTGAFGTVVEGVLLTGPDAAAGGRGGPAERRVAVKMLRGLSTSVSEQEAESMRKEVEVLGRCRHTNIVRLLGGNLAPPEMFLVEELMELSLDKLIHSAKSAEDLPIGQVLRIGRDVALGLAYLHPTVIHRDLKPANVLLDEQGTAKLSDFGLARLTIATLHNTSPEVGSVPYMAPECFETSSHKVTHRSDIFGLGVLLWEMVARLRPWSGEYCMRVALAVSIRGERLPMSAIEDKAPKRLCELIQECWNDDPYRRPSALDIAKRLTVMMQQLQKHPQYQLSPGASDRLSAAASGPLGKGDALQPKSPLRSIDVALELTSPDSQQQDQQQQQQQRETDAGSHRPQGSSVANSSSNQGLGGGGMEPLLHLADSRCGDLVDDGSLNDSSAGRMMMIKAAARLRTPEAWNRPCVAAAASPELSLLVSQHSSCDGGSGRAPEPPAPPTRRQ